MAMTPLDLVPTSEINHQRIPYFHRGVGLGLWTDGATQEQFIETYLPHYVVYPDDKLLLDDVQEWSAENMKGFWVRLYTQGDVFYHHFSDPIEAVAFKLRWL